VLFFRSIRELSTSFTTKDTEWKHEKLEKMRNTPKGDQKYFKPFVFFRIFREIRVRARSQPSFPLFFLVSFYAFSVLSEVRSNLIGIGT